jgi:serine/tyrosine/threonine adenylyltransferase
VDAITQETTSDARWDTVPFDNSYARLPDGFYTRLNPTPVSSPRLIKANWRLAASIGVDPEILEGADSAGVLSGNLIPGLAQPLAMVYAAHQFGNWVPRLGDGRAILLGEVVGPDGIRRDIQLKGSGPTPYSRMGDGRAALGPVMREYIVSEAMAGLGIRTTRALAMAMTGEIVRRETPEPGAILTRVAESHIRVGTFQYFHGQRDAASIRMLADYVINRHYPAAKDATNPYQALLEAVALSTAELIGSWMLVGFIHGVMNTDNCSISGETIDYGPCAFMDTFHPETVYSSIDSGGRYAFDQQPSIGLWNVTRLAETLLPLFDDEDDRAIEMAKEALAGYWPYFEKVFHGGLCAKIGLPTAEKEDFELALDLLTRMGNQRADFTLTFRRLCDAPAGDTGAKAMVRMLFDDPEVYDEWDAKWRGRLESDGVDITSRRQAMRALNPAFIPRNHLVQKAIDYATQAEDFGPMEELLCVVVAPFDDHPGHDDLTMPPTPDQAVTQTFCGT